MRAGLSRTRFVSDDVELDPAPEAFASAFLAAADHRGRVVDVADPLDAGFLEGMARRSAIHRRWWELPPGAALRATARAPEPKKRHPHRALLFSGGVDSFFSLLCGPRPDVVVFVHGIDMDVRDTARLAAFRPTLAAVCEATGARPAVVRTDLRRHPWFRSAPWAKAHGGALTAAALVLGRVAGTVGISGSDGGPYPVPWGSHPETDPLASTSRVRIEQVGWQHERLEKLASIAEHPLVQRHLRVCWVDDDAALNCGRCEKCLRNMTFLLARGVLARCASFPPPVGGLEAAIDRLPPLQNLYVQEYWAGTLAPGLPDGVAAAVRRLLARSGWFPGQVERVRVAPPPAPAR